MPPEEVKITDLNLATSIAETDILPIVRDPSGTPTTDKITVKTLLDERLNYSIVGSNFSLTAGTGLQSAFPTTGDVFTLSASTTYEFEGIYFITKSGTTCTTSLAFALGGGASVTSIKYHVLAQNTAVNTTGATVASAWVNQVASTVVNATATTDVVIKFKGLIRMNAGGTVTPQVQFSAAPTSPVMTVDSHIKFTPIGTTNHILGSVD
jgi:hypothetical protein